MNKPFRQLSFDLSEARDQAHARTTDPITSHEAATSITVDQLRKSQRSVYDCFALNIRGMADFELEALYKIDRKSHGWPKQSDSGIRTRRKELVDAGFLEDSGRTARTLSGRRSVIWEKTDK